MFFAGLWTMLSQKYVPGLSDVPNPGDLLNCRHDDNRGAARSADF